MKSYKDFAKESIGSSDIGALVLVGGWRYGYIQNQFLFFGEDGSYRAYMVTGADVEIGSHYEKVAAFKGGLESMMMMERLLKRVLLRLTCIVPEILAVLSRRCSRSASAVLLGCCSLNSGARPEAPLLRYRLTE